VVLRGRVPRESAVATWLYRVALNTAIAWNRKQKRHQQPNEPLEAADVLFKTALPRRDSRLDWLYAPIVTERSNAATEERLKSGHAVGAMSIV